MIDNQQDTSVTALFGQLVGDARELAQAEVAVVKVRVSEAVGRYRSAAIFFGSAGVLVLAALIALLVGLIMTLTPLVGPGFATLIVVGVVFGMAAVLGLIGRSKLAAGHP